MTNHTIDTCFKKHRYPPHWQPHQSHINNVNNSPYDNHQEIDDQSDPPEDSNQDQSTNSFSFTPDRHKALLAFLQQASSTNSHSVNQTITQSNPLHVLSSLYLHLSKLHISFLKLVPLTMFSILDISLHVWKEFLLSQSNYQMVL